MARRLALGFPIALLAVAFACATLSGDPRRLRDEAQALVDAGRYEEAYRTLARIRREHPDSEEARAVFPAAALLFQRAWHRHRYTEPDSAWLRGEPAFLFDWLASFFADGFPQAQVEALLVGMPAGFVREYEAYARKRPETAGWTLRTEDDNGIVEAVSAIPGERAAR